LRLILKLSCLCLLGLLASPLVAQPGSSPSPFIRTGSLKIAIDPAAVSFLPIDTEELRARLCSGRPAVDNWGAISPRGECNVSVAPPPNIDLYVDGVTPDGSSSRIALHSGGSTLWPGSAPVDTPCGLWDVCWVLEPDAAQPASELALETAGEEPAQGVFAGVVQLAVRYRFVNRGKKTSYELPAVVSLELSGHWAAVPAGGTSLGPGISNLLLFTGVSGGQWASAPACGTWGGTRCPVCLTPGPDVIPVLNGDH